MKTLEQIEKEYKDQVPVPIIKIATDELGLKVYGVNNLSDEQSGVIKKEKGNFVIYVNDSHSPERKRFTIAHEVAHFLKHKDEIGEEYVTSVKQHLRRGDEETLGLKERWK